jgi:hypothetical protein
MTFILFIIEFGSIKVSRFLDFACCNKRERYTQDVRSLVPSLSYYLTRALFVLILAYCNSQKILNL